ncbi:MAG: right-handed parallel beta-helix repeat-containing protein [Myxococcales bacterium]|jgi:CSLREA domain-containing protein|nr:right-handed parallel beta-helix repeat-containing protein [Myxococcales bacterium]
MPRPVHRRPLFAAAVVLGLLVSGAGAGAATFTVTKTADGADGACDADCSLRDAVIAANAARGADTIVVPPGTYVLTGAGNEDMAASGDLDLRDSVAIVGAGADLTIIDGGGSDRVFDIVATATVTLSGLTIRNGRVPDGDTQGGGGLLWNEPDTGRALSLTLTDVVVTSNDGGRGLDGGGGIRIEQEGRLASTVVIRDSTVSDNTVADGDGGGLHLCCEHLTVTIERTTISGNSAADDPEAPGLRGEGGGIYHCCNDTTLSITDSTISDNDAPTQGGGIYACCGESFNTLVTLQRSTVSGNRALGSGAFQGMGGGIEGEGAVLLVNSTLSGNQARRDGGGIDNEDVLVMRNVTIAGNSGGRGGGFYEDGLRTTLANVLFADNVEPPGTPANCRTAVGTDPLVSGGGNLSSDATCPLGGFGDRSSVDPLLEPLADNGGPTATHALVAASPAVDGGRDVVCEAVDQRGNARPTDGNGDGAARCDVGAFELAAAAEDCSNGVDDNGNGLVDCDDLECTGKPFCPERCDNCLDDDGDGAVDRDDADCAPRADGAGAEGDGGPRSRLVVRCAGALRKGGAKAAMARARTLRACVAHLAACVQKKEGDAACLARAGDACKTALARLGAATETLRATIAARCEPLTSDELLGPAGLGWGAEAAGCASLGIAPLRGPDDVGRCLLAEHACATDRLIAFETPRSAELLALGDVPASALRCPPLAGGGSAGGLGARGRIVDACTRAVQKIGDKLASRAAAVLRMCAGQVLACRQRRPGDTVCMTRARTGCPRRLGAIDAGAARLVAALAKKCGAPAVAIGELLEPAGGAFQRSTPFCKALGVPNLDSVAALGDCLLRHHRCRVRQLVESELPRLDELLRDAGAARP